MRNGTSTPRPDVTSLGGPDNAPDFRAAHQDIGAFEQSARVDEMDGETVVGFNTFAEPTELHDQRRENREPDGNENSHFQFQSTILFVHLVSLQSVARPIKKSWMSGSGEA